MLAKLSDLAAPSKLEENVVRATKRRPSIFTREEQRRLPAISPQPQPLGGAGEGLSLQELQQDFVSDHKLLVSRLNRIIHEVPSQVQLLRADCP